MGQSSEALRIGPARWRASGSGCNGQKLPRLPLPRASTWAWMGQRQTFLDHRAERGRGAVQAVSRACLCQFLLDNLGLSFPTFEMEVRRSRLPRATFADPACASHGSFSGRQGSLFTLAGAWQVSLDEYPDGGFCVGALVSISLNLSCSQAWPGSQHHDVEGPKFHFPCLVSEGCDPCGSLLSPPAAAANPDLGCLQELLFVSSLSCCLGGRSWPCCFSHWT